MWLASVVLYTTFELTAIVTIFIFLKNNNYDILTEEVTSFKFSFSTFDLVFLGVLRFSILIGASLGILWNDVHSTKRIQRSTKFVSLYGALQATYVLVKIIYAEDDNSDFGRFWALSGITLFSSVALYYCWSALGFHHSFNKSQRLKDSGSNNKVLENNQLSTAIIILELLKVASPDICFVVPAFMFLVICSLCQSVIPFYTGLVVNNLVIERSLEKSNKALLVLALVTLLRGVSAGVRAGLFRYILGRYKLRLQRSLFSSFLHMEIGFFDAHKTGELSSRLSADCSKIGDGLGLRLNIFIRSLVKLFGVLFFMVKLSWKLSTVTLVSIPVVGILSKHFGHKLRSLSDKVQNTLAVANASAEEVLSSMKTDRSFANENTEIKQYSQLLDITQLSMKSQSIMSACFVWSTELTNFVMALLTLYYGGHLFLKDELVGGHLVSFILYSFELTYATQDIGDVYTGLMEVIGAAQNIFLYTRREPRVQMNTSASSKFVFEGDVEFKNVTFSYPSRPEVTVLNNVSFTSKKGEVVALVGSSGSGKSSIVNLLAHFYETDSGDVLIDGVSVRDYNHQVLHEKMSLVQQEPTLFARSLLENIRYGVVNDVSISDVEAAAELANAHAFIMSLSHGYETNTGEKGIQLSGGQKQRVAIARALIRKPTILLLDEATSALDAESEHLVQQAINNNLSGRTVIVIAHRLSTVEKADKILVMHEGEIVEEGKHVELVEKDGIYSELVKKQLLQTNVAPHRKAISREMYTSRDRRRDSMACFSCSSLISVFSNVST